MTDRRVTEPWVLEQMIRELAYTKWERAGCPPEMHIHFWLEAEQEVLDSYEEKK